MCPSHGIERVVGKLLDEQMQKSSSRLSSTALVERVQDDDNWLCDLVGALAHARHDEPVELRSESSGGDLWLLLDHIAYDVSEGGVRRRQLMRQRVDDAIRWALHWWISIEELERAMLTLVVEPFCDGCCDGAFPGPGNSR